MVCDDYVNEELAKLLKKKGFDQNCPEYYEGGHRFRHYHGEVLPRGKETYAAPTLSVAAKWLKEEHHLFLSVDLEYVTLDSNPFVTYSAIVYHLKYTSIDYVEINGIDEFDSPSKALENAIEYCLINLI